MTRSPRRTRRDVTSTPCRVWHPSAAAGGEARVVIVVVDCMDEAAARAADYAERIPAASHRALLVAPQAFEDSEPPWTGRLRDVPLQIVAGADALSAVRAAVTSQLAEEAVHHVVVVLAPTRCARSTSWRWRHLATVLRRIDGVAPILLPSTSI